MKGRFPVLLVARSLAATIVLILIVLFMSGAFADKITPGVLAEEGRRVPPLARTVTVREQPLAVFEQATGTVEAQRRTTVSSRILATIDRILVRAGDEVRQGDPLIELDAAELDARVSEAHRAVDAAAADEARRSADLHRAAALLRTGVLSRGEYDQTEAAARVAEADLERARDVLDRAEINRTYATIRAPVSGKVVDRMAEPGDTATPGTPLLSLYDPSALRIEVPVRESLVSRVLPGTSLTIEIGDGGKLDGVVDEIVPYAEVGSRTFLVKIGLPHRDDVYAGMFGRVFIPTGERVRLLAPSTAIERIGQLEFATVVNDQGRPLRRLVTTGAQPDGEDVEVLSGLAAGESLLLPAPLDDETRPDVGHE